MNKANGNPEADKLIVVLEEMRFEAAKDSYQFRKENFKVLTNVCGRNDSLCPRPLGNPEINPRNPFGKD